MMCLHGHRHGHFVRFFVCLEGVTEHVHEAHPSGEIGEGRSRRAFGLLIKVQPCHHPSVLLVVDHQLDCRIDELRGLGQDRFGDSPDPHFDGYAGVLARLKHRLATLAVIRCGITSSDAVVALTAQPQPFN